MSARCPSCNKVLTDAMREARPFCSARCRQIDLGRWLNDEYRISGTEQEGTEAEADVPMVRKGDREDDD